MNKFNNIKSYYIQNDKPLRPLQDGDSFECSDNKKNKNRKNIALITSFVAIGLCVGLGIKKLRKSKLNNKANNLVNNGLAEIKEDFQNTLKKYPKDKIYYNKLASAIGLKKGHEYKLNSIVGSEQLENLLTNFVPEDFSIGKNMSSVKNRTLRVNLHNHTTASDGKLTPEKLLNQASNWADEIHKKIGNDGKPPFTIAITDHDTLDGAKEIVKIVSENPEKYKNLKIVLGSEASVSHINQKDVKTPMNFELIGYSLNPFNKNLNNLFSKTKENRSKLVKNFIDKTKKQYPQYDFNIKDTESFHANLKNMRTNGVIYLCREYLLHKMMLTEYVKDINEKIIPKNQPKLDATNIFRKSKDNFYMIKDNKGYKGDGIREYYKDYVLTPLLNDRQLITSENKKIYDGIFNKDVSEQTKFLNNTFKEFFPTIYDTKDYIMTPKEIFVATKDGNSDVNGFWGVAHPGLINASMYSEDVEKVCNKTGFDKGEHLAWRLYKSLKDSGGDLFKATEANYQSYNSVDSSACHWQQYMGNGKAEEFNLLKTGGIDCHKPSIFKKHNFLTDSEIIDNNLQGII